MKLLNWLKDNLNVVSLMLGLGFVLAGEQEAGLNLIKGGLQ